MYSLFSGRLGKLIPYSGPPVWGSRGTLPSEGSVQTLEDGPRKVSVSSIDYEPVTNESPSCETPDLESTREVSSAEMGYVNTLRE